MSNDTIKTISKVLSVLNGDKFSVLETLRKLSISAADGDSVDTQVLNQQIEEVKANLARIDDLLFSYELYLDKQLPILQAQLESMITDRISALKAIDQFDISYFRNIPMSLNAKQAIAGTLLNLTRHYANSDNTFWVSLQNGNSNVLAQVIFHMSEIL